MSKFLRVHFVEQAWGFAKVAGEVMNASLSVHEVGSIGVAIGDVVAVSHVWGNAQCVVENVQGTSHCIKISSPEKMRHLLSIARNNKWENLWLDNMCVNQEDDDEKSREVMKMGYVYRETKATVILLGSTRSELLKETLPEILHCQGMRNDVALPDEMLGHVDWGACIDKYVELGRDEWYERLWTVQESTLALTLYMAPVDKDVVYDVSGLKDCDQVFHRLVNQLVLEHGWSPLDPRGRAIWNLHRRWIAKAEFTMYGALLTASQSKCSVEKDRVYGMLGLIPNVNITPTYDDTALEEVAVMVIKECVNNLKQMDLLDLRGPNLKEMGKHMVPTWNSLKDPQKMHEGEAVHYGNCSYDKNVGLMVSNPRVFQAKIVAVIEPDMEPDSLTRRPLKALKDLPFPRLLRALEEKLDDDQMVELIRGMMFAWEIPQYRDEGKARESLNILRHAASSLPFYKNTLGVLEGEFGRDYVQRTTIRTVCRGDGAERMHILGITKDNNCPCLCCKRTYISVMGSDAPLEEDNLVVVDYGGHVINRWEGDDDDRVPLIVAEPVQEGLKFIATIVVDRGILHESTASEIDAITIV